MNGQAVCRQYRRYMFGIYPPNVNYRKTTNFNNSTVYCLVRPRFLRMLRKIIECSMSGGHKFVSLMIIMCTRALKYVGYTTSANHRTYYHFNCGQLSNVEVGGEFCCIQYANPPLLTAAFANLVEELLILFLRPFEIVNQDNQKYRVDFEDDYGMTCDGCNENVALYMMSIFVHQLLVGQYSVYIAVKGKKRNARPTPYRNLFRSHRSQRNKKPKCMFYTK